MDAAELEAIRKRDGEHMHLSHLCTPGSPQHDRHGLLAEVDRLTRKLHYAEQKIEALENQVGGLLRQRDLVKEALR